MYHNNDFIYDASVQLENLTGFKITIESSRSEYDAIMTIENIQFVVVGKSEIRSNNKGLVLTNLKDLESKTKKPIVVIAKFIASDIAKELREKDINYIDVAGNAYIKKDKLIVNITGQKVQKSERTNQSRAFQEAGIKLIFNLLSNQKNLDLSYRELAEQTDIAIGSISNVMKELEELNFILKTDTKRILKNKTELLNRWIVAYHDVLKPKLVRKKMRFANKNNYSEWKNICLNPNNQITTLWGGEPAAALITNYLKPAKFTIFTSQNWQDCAKSIGLIPDENGDVELLIKFWKIVTPEEQSHNIVPHLLIYTDLINSGLERNIETAKIIFDNELSSIK